ncbi:hypothetical protein KC19_VG117100 [Ceratodon purpureus]|uniref:Uncharacterized protein n=1 Tax=Ceratodon purpureus TaxID=3225 RepID=A0A8T0HPK4_CERPU|nr:hypothetical protein KC19_VG117100 [Ceratodon purpureus]
MSGLSIPAMAHYQVNNKGHPESASALLMSVEIAPFLKYLSEPDNLGPRSQRFQRYYGRDPRMTGIVEDSEVEHISIACRYIEDQQSGRPRPSCTPYLKRQVMLQAEGTSTAKSTDAYTVADADRWSEPADVAWKQPVVSAHTLS